MRNANIYKRYKGCTNEAKEHILDLIQYCRKIRPVLQYYRDQTDSFNHSMHNILKNKIGLILAKYVERRGRNF